MTVLVILIKINYAAYKLHKHQVASKKQRQLFSPQINKEFEKKKTTKLLKKKKPTLIVSRHISLMMFQCAAWKYASREEQGYILLWSLLGWRIQIKDREMKHI